MLRHQPVLLEEVKQALPDQCRYFLDGTLGHAGHTQAILEEFPVLQLVGVDRDPVMLTKARLFLDKLSERIEFVQASYAHLEKISEESEIKQFDAILLDLGVNMEHFKDAERGFSIKLEGELDMRYDRSKGISAKQRLQQVKFLELEEIFEKYTDFGEKYRKWITEELLVARNKVPLATTKDLQVWARGLGIHDKKLAVIFQAIRISVNDELGELERFLQLFRRWLISGGRCIVITYHSIEDRIVKYAFKDLVAQGVGELINKKVIKPSRQEVKHNNAARSAKMRIFSKL